MSALETAEKCIKKEEEGTKCTGAHTHTLTAAALQMCNFYFTAQMIKMMQFQTNTNEWRVQYSRTVGINAVSFSFLKELFFFVKKKFSVSHSFWFNFPTFLISFNYLL